MQQSKTVLFFGPSGAGKGTQVKLLTEFLKNNTERETVYIEMGALLRAMVAEGGYSAELTGEVISHGGLMPSFIPVHLMTKHLVEHFTGEEHIIADGVVRRPDQARGFDDAMEFYGRGDYEVVCIELSEASTMERLLERGRSDDTEESIRRRMQWYHDEVAPLIDLFKERGRTIHYIDGEPSIDAVHESILNALALA